MTESGKTVDFLIELLDKIKSCVERVERARDAHQSIDAHNTLREIDDIVGRAHALWPEEDENEPDTFTNVMRLKADIYNTSLRARQLVAS
jgi:hypothetical protein